MLGSIIGSLVGAGASILGAKSNKDSQKDFAQKGIQWKVKDSLKAGIHPIYGLGANTMSFTPSNVGGEVSQIASNLGADIDRSRMATADAGSRSVIGKLALERAGLENDLLRAQIASTSARLAESQVGAPMPSGDTLKFSGGTPFQTGPGSPARLVEDEYGDIVQEFHGLDRFIYDAGKNARKFIDSWPPRKVNSGYPRFGGRR